MAVKKKTKLALGCGGLLLAFVALFALQIVIRVDRKAEAIPVRQEIMRGRLKSVLPEAQFESHTCGLHTLRAIYKAYGLDPDKANLRFRLGVDVKAVPADEESTGTLQPDMLRVLVQDHFEYNLLNLDSTNAVATLITHLQSANLAAVLIRRRQNGNLHWVAAYRYKEQKIEILDSLSEETYFEEPRPFINECALSCILVRPTSEGSESNGLLAAHYDGVSEMMNTIQRYRELNRN